MRGKCNLILTYYLDVFSPQYCVLGTDLLYENVLKISIAQFDRNQRCRNINDIGS